MALSQFMSAIDQIADEKGLDKETVLSTVEQAIAAAYRKDYGKPRQIIKVTMDSDSGAFKIFQVYKVVEEVENPESELTLTDAKKIDKKVLLEGEITLPLPYHDEFGRIAAQTAKQVIIQRLREAERGVIFSEFKCKEGEIMPATVQQMEGTTIVVNLGKANGLLIPSDQVRREHYYIGQRLRVYLRAVEESPRGPKILISRSSEKLIEGLFRLEVPEIQSETVIINSVSREAGERSKVAVSTENKAIDPVGSCVGQRGTRIQAILAELGDEKIDIILWDENPAQFIANSLSPAKIDKVEINEQDKIAVVYAQEDQLSLAIGKNGQNVRLAGKLTGYEIDIVRTGDKPKPRDAGKTSEPKEAAAEPKKTPKKKKTPTVKKVKKTTTKKKKTKEEESGQPE